MPLLPDNLGREVRLTDERVAHILTHREMLGMEGALAETLAEPLRVVRSASDSTVQLYYRRYPRTRVGDKYLCVVVKSSLTDAFVITAYLTNQIKRGIVVWPSDT